MPGYRSKGRLKAVDGDLSPLFTQRDASALCASNTWQFNESTHVWVQDAARRMAEEQAALEAKVFHTRPRLPPQHTTVLQPFSLSSAEAQVRSVLKCVWRGGIPGTQFRVGPARQRFSTAVQALERLLSWLTACCRLHVSNTCSLLG